MKKRQSQKASFTAAAFLVILAACLILSLSGVVRKLAGNTDVGIHRYRPDENGATYLGLVDWFKDTCIALCTEEFPNRVKWKEANARINRLAGKWIFEGTEVIRLNNGYLTGAGWIDYSNQEADRLVSGFQAFVSAELKCPYLYVQAPFKICEEDPQLPIKWMDNYNEQTTALLERLHSAGIDILDLRRSLHDAGFNHYDSFYITDHHWTMPTGLWAARTIAERLNRAYGLGLDLPALSDENYFDQVWQDAFLGSWGRKVTLVYAQPEDFVLPTPIDPVHLAVTRFGTEVTGGFEALYREEEIVPEDYYQGSSYGAMLYGDCGYLTVRNLDNPDGPVVAVLRESFAGAVGPYLSLAAGELHLLDARYYEGDLEELLKEIQPDVVISLLNTQCNVDVYFNELYRKADAAG